MKSYIIFSENVTMSLNRVLWLLTWAMVVKARRMHNIYWNTTNPMFRIDNTDNVIDINVDNNVWEYDQANIICPRYRTGTRSADVERYVIYNVSREEYENCRITQPHPRVIALCDKPHDLKYFTITFRSFTPTPGGLEFKPGNDYYFISTSSRNDLYRRLGGHCSTHNMRLVFKVSSDNLNDDSEDPDHKQVNVPRQNSDRSELRIDDDDDIAANNHNDEKALTKLSDFHSYLYPMRDIIELDSNSVEHEKRSEDYDNHPNEVVKQASIMHSNGLVEAVPTSMIMLVSCLMIHLGLGFVR